jgi:hypothetical protein
VCLRRYEDSDAEEVLDEDDESEEEEGSSEEIEEEGMLCGILFSPPPVFAHSTPNYTLWSCEHPTDSKQKFLPLRSARLSSLLPIKSFPSPKSHLTAKTPKSLQPPKTF